MTRFGWQGKPGLSVRRDQPLTYARLSDCSRRGFLSGQAATRTAYSRCCLPIAWFGTRRVRMPQLR